MPKNTLKQLGERIKDLRVQLKHSQEEVAERLGLSRQSIGQIEAGERDVGSLELAKLAEFFSVSVDELLSSVKIRPAHFPAKKIKGGVAFKFFPDKLKNLLLLILEKCGGKANVGETVLYKLLYFIDFDSYELLGKPITGMNYIKLQFGPVPCLSDYRPVIDAMTENNELKIVSQPYHGKIQKKYIAFTEADKKSFSPAELEIVDKVIARLSDMSARQIEDYAHEDTPWRAAKSNEVIDYDSVFFRNVPYAQRDYDEIMQDASGEDMVKELGSISKEEYEYYKNLK